MTAIEVPPDAAAPEPPRPAEAVTPPLGRTISPVAGRFGVGMAGKLVTLAALGVGCGVFMLAGGHHAPKKARTPEEPAAQVVPFEPAKLDAAASPASPPAKPIHAPPVLDPTQAGAAGQVPALQTASDVGGGQSTQAAAQAASQAKMAQLETIRGAPILAFSQSGGGLGAAMPTLSALVAPAVEAAHGPTALDQLRQGSAIGLAHADRLPNRHFLITAGTSIPCTLQTAMDTATPGYVSCLIGQDVYSDDGAVVLMEKGTKVLGEYRSGMKQGQSRLFVIWTRAVTPPGVAIGLASPASDALGRAGFDGTIDTHFWDRFGGALLLSIIDDTSAAVATRADPNGETLRVPSDAAGIALQNSIDIPPSLKKAQGSEVAIFVAQDLDFSTVYAVKAR